MKDKFFNILLITAIFLLIINLFISPNKNTPPQNTILLQTQESYTIPAGVQITVQNNTFEPFLFSPETDLTILNGSRVVYPSNLVSKEEILQTKEENTPESIWQYTNIPGKNATESTDNNTILSEEENPSESTSTEIDPSIPEATSIALQPGESYTLDLQDHYELFLEKGQYIAQIKKDDVTIIKPFEVEYRGIIGKFFIAIFYAPIYNLMAFILEMTGYQLGWTIVIITILIRLLLLWPQHKMMLSQAKMQKIQPKIKEIQEKNKGDNAALGMELMALYKKENVNPLGSCWLLLIQMPFLIVIYRVILGIQDTSNTYYLYGVLSNYNLGSIHAHFYGIDLFAAGWIVGGILSVSIGILQYIQVKMSLYFQEQNKPKSEKWVVLEKKKDATDYSNLMPDPNLMNKFMLYGMPIFVTIITYTLYAWVGIYWWVATLFMIGQQIVVNTIIKKDKA